VVAVLAAAALSRVAGAVPPAAGGGGGPVQLARVEDADGGCDVVSRQDTACDDEVP
jgi:hypothetical protein